MTPRAAAAVDRRARTRHTSRMRGTTRAASFALAGLLALPARAADARAAPEDRSAAAEVPLAVPVPEPASPSLTASSPGTGPEGPVPPAMPEGPAPPGQGPAAGAPASPTVPPPSAALDPLGAGAPEELDVAVGLGPSAPGSKAEKQLADALERSVRASTAPRTRVRRLRAGTGDARTLCRERRDDLVILVEYLPDRDEPVLLPQDCRLDRALGVRGADAAHHSELVAALWAEHEDLVRDGARERKRLRMGPKLRTGLIVGGAILAVGVAVGAVLAASLRRETVVLTVSP